MFGTVDIKLRPLRLAYLVDPGDADQVREAIRLCSTLWGGAYSPIIQLYKRMPTTWRDRHEKAWPAKAVALGYLEAFDPDIVVQLCPAIPPYIAQTRRTIVKGTEIWEALEQRGGLAPRYGIGIFEMLNGVYEEFFKYKAKYPVRVVLPRIPQQLSLFWASLFGELPARIGAVVEGRYAEAVQIEASDFVVDRLADEDGEDRMPRRRSFTGWLLLTAALVPESLGEWARGRDGAVPRDTYSEIEDSVDIHEGKTFTVRLKSLIPAFAHEYALHAETRCANEISFRFYGSPEYLAGVFPQSSGEHLERAVGGIISRGDWRTGRHGLVRLVKSASGPMGVGSSTSRRPPAPKSGPSASSGSSPGTLS